MYRPIRLIVLLATSLALAAGAGRAQTKATGEGSAQATEMPADVAKWLLAAQPAWTASASLHSGFGYKDNLLLSHTDPERSSFVRGGLEALLWHVPRGSIDYFGFADAEGTRYFSGQTVKHESQAFSGLEWRFRREDTLTFTADAQGYYLDQIFDVSDTDIRRDVAELKVQGLKVGPTVRWAPLSWLWFEGTANRNRQRFRDGLNNATITEPSGTVGVRPWQRLEISVTGSERRRDFDRRTGFSATGRPQTYLLVVHEREIEGKIVGTWDAAKRWKTTTRLGGISYQDNGSGYLNYTEHKAAQEIEWTGEKWSFRASGGARRKDYELQTVGFGVLPPKQVKDEFDASLRVERKLSDRWTLYGEYSWERTRSNDELSSYRMNEGLLGARWSWEK